MSEFELITQALASGGDVAITFIAYAIYRLDKRVSRLEARADALKG